MIEEAGLSTLAVFAATIAKKSAEAPAHTLNLLWKVTFGRWDPWMESIIRENIEKYAKDIDDEVSKIPSENINPEPDISLIGPALEASKYYVAKEKARKMFAKLIAAEMDVTKSGQVHHAFVDIIKQMSSNDAVLLKLLPPSGPLCEIKLYNEKGTRYIRLGTADMIYIPDQIENNFTNNAISINNLSRLGLVEIDHVRSLADKAYYEAYKDLMEYQQGLLEFQARPEEHKEIRVDEGLFSLTPFGNLFREICL